MAKVFLNGELIDEWEAKISVFDRGFLFADSIYEVTAIINGQMVDAPDHFARLQRSCAEMGFENPLSVAEFQKIHNDLRAANKFTEGVVYLQITRGAAARDFVFSDTMTPTVLAFSKPMNIVDHPLAKTGIRIKTMEDLRWARCDIKTTQLTAQSLIKTQVKNEGYNDAWMIRDGLITEGTSNNAFIIDDQGVIMTRQLSPAILGGVTRGSVIQIAKDLGYQVEERPFTVSEALSAREAFSTSTSTIALPVVAIDGQKIGEGVPGPVFRALRQAYIDRL